MVIPSSQEVAENKYTLLIIEDNDDLREYLRSRLLPAYDVIVASNANMALEIIFNTIPDIILCDIIIPGKNGMEITQIIKEDIRTSFIPIILLTALSDEKLKIQGLQNGADAYITKPFNIKFVEQTIENLISNREKTKEHFSGLLINEEKSKPTKKTDRKFISDFTSIVEKNIPNENFNVENICTEMGISRIQLYRKVKKTMDYSVNDYIVHTRLQKAKYYIQHEDLSLSEIAFKVGFSSSSYFSTAFKTLYGISPSDYKQNKTSTEKDMVLP
jgi:YesN/AraC family two-component response regulator